MGLRRTAEERYFPRYYNVSPKFPGRLCRPGEDDLELKAKVLDVSRDGLGVLAPIEVCKGETLHLHLGDKKILLTVVYCNLDLIHKGKFRCGLQRIGSAENLVSLFSSAGLLVDK